MSRHHENESFVETIAPTFATGKEPFPGYYTSFEDLENDGESMYALMNI